MSSYLSLQFSYMMFHTFTSIIGLFLLLYLAAKSKDEHADTRPLFAVCDAARSEVYKFACFSSCNDCRKLIWVFGLNLLICRLRAVSLFLENPWERTQQAWL